MTTPINSHISALAGIQRAGLLAVSILSSAFLVTTLVLLLAVSNAQAKAAPHEGVKQTGMQSASVTLTIWSYSSASPMTDVINDFQTAYPTITVHLIVTDTGAMVTAFPAAARSGVGPDLLWQTPSDQMILFASQGLLRSVDAGFDLTPFLTDTVDGALWQGSLWGVPETNGNHLMLLYNKSLLSTPPTNTATMISVAQTFTGSTYGLVYSLNEPFWLMPWLGGFNGWPLDLNANPITPTLNTTAMVSALQFVQDLKTTHHIVPTSCDYGCADTNFTQGNAAMLINGDWSLSSYTGLSPTVQLGIARIPIVSSTGLWPSPMANAKYFVFNSYTSDQQYQASRLFVQFATTKTEQLRWAQVSILPARQDALQDSLVQNDLILQASANQMLVGRPMPAVPEMRCAWDAMFEPIADVMDSGLSPTIAAAQMQVSAVACINEMHQQKLFLPFIMR